MSLINCEKAALEALESDDEGVRYHAVWWLGKNRVRSSVSALIRCLHDERERTSAGGYPLRRQAARSLGLIKDASCVKHLVQTLDSDDVQLHEASIQSLINLKSDDCVDALVNYLERKIENKPIESLIEALTFYRAWSVKDKIFPFLNDRSERIQGAANAYYFACTCNDSYFQNLLNLLDHENSFVRQSAAFDLARIAPLEKSDLVLESNIPNNIKMHVLKSILARSLPVPSALIGEPEFELSLTQLQREWFSVLDQHVAENFSGNLLIQEKNDLVRDQEPEESGDAADAIALAFRLFKSRSLADREHAADLLGVVAVQHPELILSLHQKESDQDLIMGLVKVMAASRCEVFVPALIDAVGLDIANHCQGNIRRVAVCALGGMLHLASTVEIRSQIIDKLVWALTEPEDWGLRYGAICAMDQISASRFMNELKMAFYSEEELLNQVRIGLAIENEIQDQSRCSSDQSP